jgi:hypothetical protein
MMPSTLRQVFTLMLAIFVSVGMGLSVVQASSMTVRMAATTERGAPGQGDCHACECDGPDMAKSKTADCPACDGADMAKSKSAACMAICVGAVAFAPVSPVGLAAVIQAETRASLPKTALLSGSSFPPDPYPPRSSDIG